MNPSDTTTFTFDTVHTAQNPYCDDISCWCHNESTYHDVVTQPFTNDADATLAYAFFGIGQGREVQAS